MRTFMFVLFALIVEQRERKPSFHIAHVRGLLWRPRFHVLSLPTCTLARSHKRSAQNNRTQQHGVRGGFVHTLGHSSQPLKLSQQRRQRGTGNVSELADTGNRDELGVHPEPCGTLGLALSLVAPGAVQRPTPSPHRHDKAASPW